MIEISIYNNVLLSFQFEAKYVTSLSVFVVCCINIDKCIHSIINLNFGNNEAPPRNLELCPAFISTAVTHEFALPCKKIIFTPYSCCTVFLLLYLCVFLCSLHQVYSHIMASDLFLHESQAPVTCRSHFGRKGGLQ